MKNKSLYDTFDLESLKEQFNKIKHRGPDDTSIVFDENYFFGFHRLSINDLTTNGNQPFQVQDSITICNGEIYNWKELNDKHKYNLKSNSDCEILSHMFNDTLDKQYICNNLDGVFALIHYNKSNKYFYVARDPIGVRPLFYTETEDYYAFSSEAKAIFNYGKTHIFPISTLMSNGTMIKYYTGFSSSISMSTLNYTTLKNNLVQALHKRIMNNERDIGFFLSGGLDSSLMASIAKQLYPNQKIKTFSIGTDISSPDLVYARTMASVLDSEHHEVIYTLDEGIKVLDEVIYHLESYDTTTIRASIPMYLLCKYISKNTKIKVMISGEGADELFGGYLYFHNAPNPSEFQKETIKLLKNVHMFDSLRADRCTAAWGLEVRVPFFDKTFLNYVLGIHESFKHINTIEKYILRKAFDTHNYITKDVLWRQKNAFSDAVGYNWITHLKNHVESIYENMDEDEIKKQINTYTYDIPQTNEELHYRNIYTKHFGIPNLGNYGMWRAQWSNNLIDPSATYLCVHQDSRIAST